MKTYKGNGNNEGGEKAELTPKKKILYTVISVVAILMVALAITLSVVFGTMSNNNSNVVKPDDKDKPDDKNPPIEKTVYYAPISGTVTKEAYIDELVYMESLNMWKVHMGVDISANEGDKVLSVADGKVTNIEKTTLEGVVVTIEHKDGVVSVYKSLTEATVEVGDSVSGGAEIGVVGTMMIEKNEGMHLHLEMYVNGDAVNPLDYVDLEVNK